MARRFVAQAGYQQQLAQGRTVVLVPDAASEDPAEWVATLTAARADASAEHHVIAHHAERIEVVAAHRAGAAGAKQKWLRDAAR